MLESQPHPSGLTRQQILAWRNGIFVVFGVCGVGLASWMARTPAVKDALGVTTAQMGLLILGLAVGSIIGLTLSSHLIGRLGTKTVMIACLATAPVGLAVAGIGVSLWAAFWIVMMGLFIFGVAFGMCDVTMNLSGAVNERMLGRTIMPVFHAFFSFGTMIGAAVGTLAEYVHISIATQSVVIASIVLVAGVWGARATQSEHVMTVPPQLLHGAESGNTTTADSTTAAGADPVGWRERLALWRDPGTLLIGVIVLGMAFAEGSANDWLSLASVEGHGVDKPTGAIIFGIFVTAMTAGRLAGPKVLDRFGRVRVLRVSAALAALGLLVFVFVPVLWIAIGGVVLWGLGSALGFPTGMSAAADDPRTAAARVSVVATIGYFAFLVGPPVLGFLGEHFGLLHALLLVFVLIAFAGLASGAARERSQP